MLHSPLIIILIYVSDKLKKIGKNKFLTLQTVTFVYCDFHFNVPLAKLIKINCAFEYETW